MSNEEVLQLLNDQFSEAVISVDTPCDFLTLEIAPEMIHQVIEWMKLDQRLQLSFLTNIGGVHYPDNKGREFAVVYHLHSLKNNIRIRLKAFLSNDLLEIDSLTDIYAGANWMERETYDFYGINFKGHPNLKRILNEDTMDYFPMRKEYHLEDATREDKDDRFFGR